MNTVDPQTLLQLKQERMESLNRALDDLLDDIFSGRLVTSGSIDRVIATQLAEAHWKTYTEVVNLFGLRVEAHLQKGVYTTERIAALPAEVRSYIESARPAV